MGGVGENWIEHEMEDEMEHEFILLYDHYEIEKLRENQIVALFSIFSQKMKKPIKNQRNSRRQMQSLCLSLSVSLMMFH